MMKNKTKIRFIKNCCWIIGADTLTVNKDLGQIMDYGIPCKECLVKGMCIIKSEYKRVVFSRSAYKCDALCQLARVKFFPYQQ